jgi:hypothetical protein
MARGEARLDGSSLPSFPNSREEGAYAYRMKGAHVGLYLSLESERAGRAPGCRACRLPRCRGSTTTCGQRR